MNREVAQRLMTERWEPVSYNVNQLMQLLSISREKAEKWIHEINAELRYQHWVTHHDLVVYLNDLLSIEQLPQTVEEAGVSVQGYWRNRS